MEKYKNKKTGVVYLINDAIILEVFKKHPDYIKVSEKQTKKVDNKTDKSEIN